MHDLSDVLEVNRVWDSEALHAVSVSPLLEVLLEGTPAPVAGTTANLTLELFAKTMQLE